MLTYATGLNHAQIKTLYYYNNAGWDFAAEAANGTADIWQLTPLYSHPVFIEDNQSSLVAAEGAGTAENPYIVDDVDDLYWLGGNPFTWDKYIEQTCDINANETQGWMNGAGYWPIGTASTPFTGNYNGNDYTISNLYLNRTDDNNQGMFGVTDNANIYNINLTNLQCTGKDNVGGLVALAGTNTQIDNCQTNGTVTGTNFVGGLAGTTQEGANFNYCNSDGEVHGQTNVGGFGGRIYCSNVSNSYSWANANAAGTNTDMVGGFVGNFMGNDAGVAYSHTIKHCYSTGEVTGDNNLGGFIGDWDYGDVINCYWDTETSGQYTSDGGTGCSTSDMQSAELYAQAGWDVIGESINGTADIWFVQPGQYPVFYGGGMAPVITAVADVPNDQGHNLQVVWRRSLADTQFGSSYYYSVWRLLDFNTRSLPQATVLTSFANFNTQLARANHPVIVQNRNQSWEYLQSVPAQLISNYSLRVPTLVDSCATMQPSQYQSTFKVCYHFGASYYTSASQAGYSVDNIPPCATSQVGLAFAATRNQGVRLNWQAVSQGYYKGNYYPEQNGVWYKVYAADTPNFECNHNSFIAVTRQTSLDIDVANVTKKFFKVVVSDQQ